MLQRKQWYAPTVLAALLVASLFGPAASANLRKQNGDRVSVPPSAGEFDDWGPNLPTHQHGPMTGHLPPVQENVELLGKLKLTSFADDISDVSALGDFAYVGDWGLGGQCSTGGVNVVDISDPTSPEKVKFLNAGGSGYQTEGVQALNIGTSAYSGDILIVSNEWCREMSNPKQMPGGITIYDINDPTSPKTLVHAFGDFDGTGTRAHEAHSVIAWDAGNNAYAAAIDNEEVDDVDILDITDPRNPEVIFETDLAGVNVDAHGDLQTSHDFDVLRFNNDADPALEWNLMVSDWDAGWVHLDVTNPHAPFIVGETDYATCDQVVQTLPGAPCLLPEGNAHQGEWTSNGDTWIGTDEDFDAYRTSPLTRTTGPGAPEEYSTVGVGGAPVTILPDKRLNGPVAYGGYGCPGTSAPIPPADTTIPPSSLAPGEEQIIVLQRGPADDPNNPEPACFPGEKADNATDQGWDAVVLTGRHLGSAAADEPPNCGFGAFPADEQIPTVCTTHTAMHELFGRTPDYTVPYPVGDPGDLEPNIGEVGFKVDITATFDGWGYVRVFDTANPASPTEISQIYIPETIDEAKATGFGDITIHETEVPRGDLNEGGPAPDDDKLAYFSWYSGGLRVWDITDPANPEQVGAYIDAKGNDFWGVAITEDENGDRIILASDMDFGLFIFRYTGPVPA
jgi:hypothetical protein